MIKITKRKKMRKSEEEERSALGGALFGGNLGDDECSSLESGESVCSNRRQGLDYTPSMLNAIATMLFTLWDHERRNIVRGV